MYYVHSELFYMRIFKGITVGGVLQEDGHQLLRKLVLDRCPAWEKEIKDWEKQTGNVEMGRCIYLEASTMHNSPWVAAYWMASYPDLMASFHRNLDKDCSGIDVLDDAPVNTDFVEGNMGVVDHLRHISQACRALYITSLSTVFFSTLAPHRPVYYQAHIENVFGMASCNRMQLFSTAEQAMDRTEQRMKKKAKTCWVAKLPFPSVLHLNLHLPLGYPRLRTCTGKGGGRPHNDTLDRSSSSAAPTHNAGDYFQGQGRSKEKARSGACTTGPFPLFERNKHNATHTKVATYLTKRLPHLSATTEIADCT